MVIHKKIYNKIKEYDKIVIARHIGPDPDALGSTNGLKDIIKETFPKKEVYTIGERVIEILDNLKRSGQLNDYLIDDDDDFLAIRRPIGVLDLDFSRLLFISTRKERRNAESHGLSACRKRELEVFTHDHAA